MSKKQQIYYNAVFGALGGFVAWLLLGQVNTQSWSIWIETAFLGAGIGLFIGIAVGLVEGIVVKRSAARAAFGAALGGLVGLISGTLGLLIGEVVFLIVSGGLVARALGFMLLGLCLGLGEGFVSQAATQRTAEAGGSRIQTGKRISYSVIGGTLAGLVGGLLYEGLTQVFLQDSESAQVVLGGLGLILIGACLGGIIPLSVEAIARVAGRGSLVVLDGRRRGLEESVVDAVTLGSYDGCNVYLPGDAGIDGKQATIFKGRDGFFVRNISKNGVPIWVGGVQLAPGMADHRLQSNAEITLGQTRVQFREG